MSEEPTIKSTYQPPAFFRLRRFFACVFLLVLAEPIITFLHASPSVGQMALVFGGLAGFVGGYCFIMLRGPRLPLVASPAAGRNAWLTLALLISIACLLTLIDGSKWLILLIFASGCVGKVQSVDWAPRTIIALALLAVVLGWQAGATGRDLLELALLICGGGFIMVSYARLSATIQTLHTAHEELARLAITEERLRFARDLHDLLGHSLSLIALKSELAGRLVSAAPERAKAEIGEVEREARSALQEVREAVANYRQPTLARELRAAQEILTAAGIAYHYEGARLVLPPVSEAALAWAVREGVTNVIRHSHARQCSVLLEHIGNLIRLEVRDDGCGVAGELLPGSGLRGLAERLASLGGTCQATSPDDEGFCLAVSLPLEATSKPEPTVSLLVASQGQQGRAE